MRLGYSLSDEPTKPDPVPSELSAQIFRVNELDDRAIFRRIVAFKRQNLSREAS